MKLVVAKPNLPAREIGIIAVNGHRLVTDEGVFCLTPLADEWGQPIADGDKLPPFGLVKVSPVLDRPGLTVEFPEEAMDQYERHLAYCKEHKLTPGTRAQHKAWEQAELEPVSGLPDDVRPYCLTDLELATLAVGVRGGLSADSKVRFRAFFQSGDTVTKWFLKDFQPVAPLMGETSNLGLQAVPAIQELAADVKALTARKAKRDRKTYSRAAKAKAKWFGHEQDLSQMAKHAKKFLKRDKKTRRIIRGGWDTVIDQGKGWWKRQNFADPKLSALLDDQSKQWLRRIILKDWREEKLQRD